MYSLLVASGVASGQASGDYTITCIPKIEVTALNHHTKRHMLVLKEGKVESELWLGDGEEPELRNLHLKPKTAYRFVLVHRPDWAGAAVAMPGVTSPPGFLKEIWQGDQKIWVNKPFQQMGLW